jgi:hypothetical protein
VLQFLFLSGECIVKKALRKFEDELATALEAVNDAEIAVETAAKNVKLALFSHLIESFPRRLCS